MRVITIVSLGASAVLGLGALIVAKTVLPNQAAAKPAAAAASVAAGVPIVVAAKDIKYGDKLEPGMLTIARVPAEVAPQGAFSSLAQVLSTDKGGPPVALMAIAAREPVLPAKLSGPGARPSVAAEIAEGMRAYTIKVTDVTGVGGQALPGDHVDVVLMRDLTPTAQNRTYVSDVIVQNVRVLGVDLNALCQVLAAGGAGGRMWDMLRPWVESGDDSGLRGPIRIGAKDIRTFTRMAENAGVATFVGQAVNQMLRTALNQGYGDRFLPIMPGIVAEWNGTKVRDL